MNQTFMKEKPIIPLVISMSLPMAASMLVNSLYNIVDSYFVAKISDKAMTALSLVYPVQNLITAIAVGFSVGVSAAIAFYLGAGKQDKADQAASDAILYNTLHGILLVIGCLLFMPAFLRFFTEDEAVIAYGLSYSRIAFSFAVVITVGIAYEKIFQAVGRMKVSMISMMAGFITNIILDPVLIFGLGPFPEMGMEGAAVATGIGQVITLLVYLAFYYASPIPVKVQLKSWRPDRETAKRLYGVGIPATLNMALPSLLISALNGILAEFSQSYVLVLGAYYKLQTFLYLPANGIIQGMRPLIGYNFGAREMKRVKKIFRLTLESSCVIMLFGTVICLLASGQLMGLFTTTPETIAAGSRALKIISAGFLVSAVSVTASGALEGLGKGTQSLVISLFRYVVVIMPTAYLLSRFMGPDGVWNAFWITEVFTAIVSVMVYHKTLKKV